MAFSPTPGEEQFVALAPGARLELLLGVCSSGGRQCGVMYFCLCIHGVWPQVTCTLLPMGSAICVPKADTRPGKGWGAGCDHSCSNTA